MEQFGRVSGAQKGPTSPSGNNPSISTEICTNLEGDLEIVRESVDLDRDRFAGVQNGKLFHHGRLAPKPCTQMPTGPVREERRKKAIRSRNKRQAALRLRLHKEVRDGKRTPSSKGERESTAHMPRALST